MSKKTSVEYLEIKLLGIVSFDSEVLRNKYKEQFKIAKEMEKQQIIDAHYIGRLFPIIMKTYKGLSVDEIRAEIMKHAEQYYNETFKNEAK
jgi:hypothetical protein